MIIHELRNAGEISGITGDICGNLNFWLTILITSVLAIFPFFIVRRHEYLFSQTIINNLRQNKYEIEYAKKKYVNKIAQLTKYTRYLAKFKKLMKQDPNKVELDNYVDKRMMDIVEMYKSTKKNEKQKKQEDDKNVGSPHHNENVINSMNFIRRRTKSFTITEMFKSTKGNVNVKDFIMSEASETGFNAIEMSEQKAINEITPYEI